MKKEFENRPFKSRIIKVLDWWYHFTSLSGVTQTRDTDCKLSKASWFVFAILGFGLTCYLVTKCVEGYYAYLTETTIEISSPLEVEFPAVTICNENRVHCGNLYNLIVNCTKVNISNGIIVSILGCKTRICSRILNLICIDRKIKSASGKNCIASFSP